jgi:hypothetical protein
MYRDDRPIPLTLSCQPVGGMNARLQNVGHYQMGIKRHERLTSGASVKTNVKQSIGLATGFVKNSDLHRTNWDCLSRGERIRMARIILGPDASKNAINKMVRYGKGL